MINRKDSKSDKMQRISKPNLKAEDIIESPRVLTLQLKYPSGFREEWFEAFSNLM